MTRLPRIQYAVPQTLHARPEIARAIRALTAADNQRSERSVALAKNHSDRELVAEIVRGAWQILSKSGYDPSEPRVSAGNPDGGQWTKEGASDTNVRLAMEPIDPATGAPFSAETPLDSLGGGEGTGGGGLPGVQAASPPQIGSFTPLDNLTYGTTLFGNYAHEQIASLLQRLYPDVVFDFRVMPGQRGIDVTVLRDPTEEIGYEFGEIKPRTVSGETAFGRQLEQWGVGSVQSITYDAAGNVYYGFR